MVYACPSSGGLIALPPYIQLSLNSNFDKSTKLIGEVKFLII